MTIRDKIFDFFNDVSEKDFCRAGDTEPSISQVITAAHLGNRAELAHLLTNLSTGLHPRKK